MSTVTVTRALGIAMLGWMSMLASAQPAPSREAPTVENAIFKASDAMGILRGLKQEDSLTTLEFWASGNVVVDGAPIKTTAYRGSLRFLPVPSMREDVTRPGQKGAGRVVRAVAGSVAWDDSTPGTFQSAVSAEVAKERALRMLSLPPSVIKTARAAGAQTTMTTSGDKTTLMFPVAGLDGATMTATLTNQFLVERVEAKLGSLTVESTFGKHGDWNERDYKSDVQFPQRIVQKVNGTTVLDLTVTKTNTYNPYVVVPVPAAIKSAAGKS
jgi:hypothetical protein